MQNHMVKETGLHIFELASSLGRMHERTLSELANATSKTPFGAVFALNASFARMANEGMDTLASRLSDANAPSPAPTATQPVAKAAPKAEPAKKSAPPAVETASITVMADDDTFEPDVSDVLVEEIVASPKPPVESKTVATKDDLTHIAGIGATTAKKLNGAGIENFAQIAEMSESQFAKLLASLEIKSIRFQPKQWIEEAKELMA